MNPHDIEFRMISKEGDLYQHAFEQAGDGILLLDAKGKILDVNPAFTEITRIPRDQIVDKTAFSLARQFGKKKELPLLLKLIRDALTHKKVKPTKIHFRDRVLEVVATINSERKLIVGVLRDITQEEEKELEIAVSRDRLQKLEWLLTPKSDSTDNKGSYRPFYGNVSELNSDRTILDGVGIEELSVIAKQAIDLLDTSVAIYEKNGDYAFGLFSSGWCQLMDASSRRLCGEVDNAEALKCGKWLCHENCWNDSAKVAINTGQPTDIECVGGIHLYAEPILAGDDVIGAINIGYGNPPTDKRSLAALAKKFSIPVKDLEERAKAYLARPPYLVEYAKQLLTISARRIGDLVVNSWSEKKLSKQLQRFTWMMEASRDGLWDLNIQTGEIYYSPGYFTMLGYEPDELPHTLETYLNLLHPEEAARSKKELEAFYQSGLEEISNEMRFRTKSGKYIWILSRGRIVEYDDHGQPLRFLGTNTNIQTSKELELELRESESKLRSIIDSSPFPVALVDYRDEQIKYWSKSALELFGHCADSTEEWYKMAYPDPVYRKEIIARWKGILTQARMEKKPVNAGEYRVTCQDGSERICELYATFLTESLVVTFNDITDRVEARSRLQMSYRATLNLMDDLSREMEQRKAMDVALQESEERYRMLFDKMMDGFALHEMIFDEAGVPLDYRFLMVNKAFEVMTGLMFSEIRGKRIKEIMPGVELDQAHWIETYGEVVRTGKEIRFEDYSEPLGRWYSVLAYKVKENQFATIIQDITLRKEAQKDLEIHQAILRNQKERLQLLSKKLIQTQEEERRRISRELHDDMGQVLTSASLNLQLLINRFKNETDSETRSQLIDTHALVDQLIETMHILSRGLRPGVLDSFGLIIALHNILDEMDKRTGMKITHNLDEFQQIKLPHEIELVVFRITQEVCTNVVKHAKASRFGLVLTIDQKQLVLKLQDNGKGFDPQPFIDGERKREGLGLIGMMERAKILDGSLSISSNADSGTLITLQLPLHS